MKNLQDIQNLMTLKTKASQKSKTDLSRRKMAAAEQLRQLAATPLTPEMESILNMDDDEFERL